jgi:hypothetical protein
MGAHAFQSPETDRVVDDALRKIAADVDAARVPRLAGVVLGGGYGRGEGGVKEGGGLSNDLDFFAVAEEGSSDADVAAISRALEPVGKKWSAELGIDVDFTAKTPWRLRHDQERVMVQELVRGYCDVAGAPGAELFRRIERREAEALPWSEAARLLVNRGAGLLWAREEGRGEEFRARNLVKCVLGAGDARLIARRAYRWKAVERGEAIGDALYSRALEWKFRPRREPPCDWETARGTWLEAFAEVRAAARPRRSVAQAVRWTVRRRTVGRWRTFGWDPVVRILEELARAVEARAAFPEELQKDWMVFN